MGHCAWRARVAGAEWKLSGSNQVIGGRSGDAAAFGDGQREAGFCPSVQTDAPAANQKAAGATSCCPSVSSGQGKDEPLAWMKDGREALLCLAGAGSAQPFGQKVAGACPDRSRAHCNRVGRTRGDGVSVEPGVRSGLLLILFRLCLLGAACLLMVAGMVCVWIGPALGGVCRGRGG